MSSRIAIVAVLIVALLGAGLTRRWCINDRVAMDRSRGEVVSKAADVSRLNSYALGLLLGGLRGPLVMALWTSSENQKADRELDDFDTKVEMIRLLQLEFDGVHLFQIWNKAYNISVQMANVTTKYTTILDAMDYAFSVDAEKPDNINIISSIGGLYFDKFGNSAEKGYFSPRMQDETLAQQDRVRVTFPATRRAEVLRAARLSGASTYVLAPREANDDSSKLYVVVRKDIADRLPARLSGTDIEYKALPMKAASASDTRLGHRTEHDMLLDAQFRILPAYLTPREGADFKGDASDGSKLPYLKEFEPYPYGVSPFALSYNYYKRAQWLQKYKGARHAQMSDTVISVRPAHSLKKWSEEDWYAARRAEIELFKLPVPRDDSELEMPTAEIALDAAVEKCPLLDEVVYRYQRAAQIADAAVAEFNYHMSDDNYPMDKLRFRSHLEGSEAQAMLNRGDALYLQAMVAQGDERIRLATQSRDAYQKAAYLYTRHILRYFMADEDVPLVLPQDMRNLTRIDVNDSRKLRDQELPATLERLRQRHIAANFQLENSVDFQEIYTYVARASSRMQSISVVVK